ncbi:MAG: hypothetical protein CMJ64_04785 [Planctomycetaceae bacterium]|nr:hypothetical protein [Planctomycetaceae bacterium]
MQCAEFEIRLQDALDRRIDPESDDRLVDHAERCEACRHVVYGQRLLLDGLRVQAEPPCSSHIGHQVLDRLASDSARRTRRRRLVFALAIAVALFVAVLPFARGPRADTATARPSAKVLAIATVPQPPLPKPTMTAGETEEFRLLIRQLLDQVSLRPLEGFESVDRVAGKSIRPLAITFHFAFDTLRRTLPGQGSAEPTHPQARSLRSDAASPII